jgi:uncharacterized protein (TIGR02466 family)
MDLKYQIDNIFPTPLYTSTVKVDDSILDEIEELSYSRAQGEVGKVLISEEQQILDKPFFAEYKSEIDKHMHNFYYNVLGFSKQNYLEMVNSWVVKSLPDNESAYHLHKNSIFSGVWYISVPENSGNISFTPNNVYDKEIISLFMPKIETVNEYNTRLCVFHAQKSILILFPSVLNHKVELNQSNNPRISIAFNYFLKGKFDYPTAILSI